MTNPTTPKIKAFLAADILSGFPPEEANINAAKINIITKKATVIGQITPNKASIKSLIDKLATEFGTGPGLNAKIILFIIA